MTNIKCLKCGKDFKVDDRGYVAIVSQVHNTEFQKDLNDRTQ